MYRQKFFLPHLALAVALMAIPAAVRGQVRQPLPAPGSGIVNRAVQGLAVADGSLPGWMYFGVNAADRGLGYVGSYATLGGFIPYAEDDLGGLWAADLRGHLSVNGGFFSNVGAVRKQFLGGSLLGVGVYWDYDGDLNQYPAYGVLGTEYGQFGHVYNQVGVSGEWLTDYGNLRSNGYIPVGSTAYVKGAPDFPFADNFLLCQTGLDSALGGADLEAGVYVPSLADWAGMISVGGYALGNSRYTWQEGSEIGEAVVPWFGGVYTRLDLTFLENWDFSLQYNNDSYFNSTGFARLTYRMGGSRRRNVPDQVEQPMMRNEHIVRAHQTPIVAINPATEQPWNVIHVDNARTSSGNGTAAAPFQTLAEAQVAATQPYDIVYVRAGVSPVTPYASNWQFQAENQFLVGQGSVLQLATLTCGVRRFFDFSATEGARPVLTSDATAIRLANGSVVDHFLIQNAPIGIEAGPEVTSVTNVNDVQMNGLDSLGEPSSVSRGVVLSNLPANARANLFNMDLRNLDGSLLVDGGAPDVTFQGQILADGSRNPTIEVVNTTGGKTTLNKTSNTLQTLTASNPQITVPYNITDRNSQATPAVVVVSNTLNTVFDSAQLRIGNAAGTGVLIDSNTDLTFLLPTTLPAQPLVSGAGGDGIAITNNTRGTITLDDARIETTAGAGVRIGDNTDFAFTLPNFTGNSIGTNGIQIDGNAGASVIDFANAEINAAGDSGAAVDGNLANTNVTITNIVVNGTGGEGIRADGNDTSTIVFDAALVSNAGSAGAAADNNINSTVDVLNLLVTGTGGEGIRADGNDTSTITFIDPVTNGVGTVAAQVRGNQPATIVQVDNLVAPNAGTGGILIDTNSESTITFNAPNVINARGNGVAIVGNTGGTISLTDGVASGADGLGLQIDGNVQGATGAILLTNTDVSQAGGGGIVVANNVGDGSTLFIDIQTILASNAAGDGVVVDGNEDLLISFTGINVSEAGGGGLTVTNNDAPITSVITFTDLAANNIASRGFFTAGNDSLTTIEVNGSSNLTSLDDGNPIFESNDDAVLNISFDLLVTAEESGGNDAIILAGGATGTLDVTGFFGVANGTPPPPIVPGTIGNDVDNTSGVIVTVP